MSGANSRHYDRCDQGGSTEARPDEKMGRRRFMVPWVNRFVMGSEKRPTSAQRGVIKRYSAKKRRQRDKVTNA